MLISVEKHHVKAQHTKIVTILLCLHDQRDTTCALFFCFILLEEILKNRLYVRSLNMKAFVGFSCFSLSLSLSLGWIRDIDSGAPPSAHCLDVHYFF